MSTMLNKMYQEERIIISACMNVEGSTFIQPTGFPDIGFCIYTDSGGKRRCLVESEQSMANRLEAVCMKTPGRWVEELSHLPLIAVHDAAGNLLATNLTEPHRVASSYILESKIGNEVVSQKVESAIGLTDGGRRWPLGGREKLERLVFSLDPAALLHGFQFVGWSFVGLRQTRIISARLEATLTDEPDVDYGMVKLDTIDPNAHPKGSNKGQSIAVKERVVPADGGIEATFDIDVLSLKHLSISEDEKKFLLALALWKIAAFLSNRPAFDARSRETSPALRLRADCYLSCVGIKWNNQSLDPSDLMKLPSSPNFKELANASGFALSVDENEKRPTLVVQYEKEAARALPASTPFSSQANGLATAEEDVTQSV